MCISDWLSDVFASVLYVVARRVAAGDSHQKASLYQDHGLQLRSATEAQLYYLGFNWLDPVLGKGDTPEQQEKNRKLRQAISIAFDWEQFVSIFENDEAQVAYGPVPPGVLGYQDRSEEHTSELQSLMRISYAVFCLKKKTQQKYKQY